MTTFARDASALSSAVGRLPIHSIRRAADIPLDGAWDFQLLESDGADLATDWEAVQVPELWTMRRADDPAQYTNVPMPFVDAPPIVPARNPVGVYRRTVRLTPARDRRLILHVGAAEGHLRVVVNGREIGSSTDSHLEAEFDVTDAVVDGDNTIDLRVAKWSSQTYLEDQDQWWQSGISRSVHLTEVPLARIADVVVVADYDAASGLGSVRIDVETTGVSDSEGVAGWTVDVDLLGETRTVAVPARQAAQTIPKPADVRAECPPPRLPPDFMDLLSIQAAGAPVPERFAAIAGQFAQTLVHGAVAGVARDERTDLAVSPWTAETPHLETIAVVLRNAEGVAVDRASVRVGFRRVEIVGRDLLVNGERILIQGVNRHDVDPRTGRVMTRERLHDELALLKRFNVNAIRTSHYPNDPVFLDLCDEYGFYVVDEANIEGHAFAGSIADDPRYLASFHERYSRMLIRDRNHPCVILWSLGNETGYGAAHDALAAWSRAVDPTRPIHYEGALSSDWHAGHAATDVVCPMYPSFDSLIAFSADPRSDRPLILCEYAYSQGNSTGGLARYWELFETLPGLQGGFIWEFLDHALDPDGDGRGRYGGDFGDHPNDGYVMLNGLAFSDLTPKPAFCEARALFAPVRVVSDVDDARRGSIRIRNRQSFAGLDALEFAVRVETTSGVSAETDLTGVAAPAGGEVDIPLPAPVVAALAHPDALALSLVVRTAEAEPWAPAGTERAILQVRTGRPADPLPDAGTTPVLVEGDITHPLLVSPPRLSLWRALTDNDESFALDNRFVRSGFFSLEPEDVEVSTDEASATVTTTYRAAFGAAVVHHRRVIAIGDADWVFDERVTLPEGTADGLRVGVEFILAPGIRDATWIGLGPEENYPDRRAGALLGRWRSDVDAMAVPYLYPQHHGTRGGVTALDLSGPAGHVAMSADRELHATVTRHTAGQLEKAAHWWELPASEVTVVALDVAHRGVGTARLGPDVLPGFRLDGADYAWRWRLSIAD
ncbi:glycoside hydrolase family 2 TIM barrel-domain containing protein [Microbacterium sp. NPDC089189]|uniref:glycoside hydrolase family 2 TIM barrel-domain containing protein n=1 Tax=Microbacterium sp. NPDC089189 TaxID=3154972 RepID=UPI003427CA4A